MNEYDKLRLGFITAIRDEYAIKTDENQSALKYFRKWLLDYGNDYISDFLNDNYNLSDEFLLLVKAVIVWRGDRLKKRHEQGFFAETNLEKKMVAFVNNLWEKGEKVMRKAYAGESLSDDNFEILNLYRFLAETHILGVPVWEYEINKESIINNPYRIAGTKISLPKLPPLHDVLNKKSYTDNLPKPSLKLVSKEAYNFRRKRSDN